MSDRDDLSELLTGAIDAATERLASATEFGPFALAMQAEDGEVFHLEPDGDDLERAPSVIVAALRTGLRDAALEGRWKATAIVTDVTVQDEDGEAVTSAIQIWLEHAEGESMSCTISYEIDEEGVELAELVTEPSELAVFAPASLPN